MGWCLGTVLQQQQAAREVHQAANNGAYWAQEAPVRALLVRQARQQVISLDRQDGQHQDRDGRSNRHGQHSKYSRQPKIQQIGHTQHHHRAGAGTDAHRHLAGTLSMREQVGSNNDFAMPGSGGMQHAVKETDQDTRCRITGCGLQLTQALRQLPLQLALLL
ncbi:hypothetical protein [Thiorhodovibrio winogradskyi]|uniref:hypothetical protein n=1 Tax=Thiorhodovibrio winogradskyi TaxID=77007 RepID=UPI002E2AC15D|nr:hypothetical protein [Thiorhodovibrio winogradskyi]